MIDFRILNGRKKCTIVETFDGRGIVYFGKKRVVYPSLRKAKEAVYGMGLEVNIHHIFGSSIQREMLR